MVNGPGEAKEADIGIAGGHGSGILFKKGKVVKKFPQKKLVEELLAEVENHVKTDTVLKKNQASENKPEALRPNSSSDRHL